MCREAESIALDGDAKRDKTTTTAITTTMTSTALQSNEIDGDALRRLYGYHPAHTTCHNVMDTALRLTDHIKDMLQKLEQEPDALQIVHTTMNGCIPFLTTIDSDTEGTDEETNEDDNEQADVVEFEESSANDELVNETEADNELNLEAVASSLLRYDRSTAQASAPGGAKLPANSIASLFHGVLSETIFDPLLSDSNSFVTALDDATLNHDALNHHVLTSLSMGSWGGLPGTVKYLSCFLEVFHFDILQPSRSNHRSGCSGRSYRSSH